LRGDLAQALSELSQQRFRPPLSKSTKVYSVATLERWFYAYKSGGLEALCPSPRSDRGRCRDLTREQRKLLAAIREEHPSASIPVILRTLVAEGRLDKDAISASRVERLLDQDGGAKVETPRIVGIGQRARKWRRAPTRQPARHLRGGGESSQRCKELDVLKHRKLLDLIHVALINIADVDVRTRVTDVVFAKARVVASTRIVASTCIVASTRVVASTRIVASGRCIGHWRDLSVGILGRSGRFRTGDCGFLMSDGQRRGRLGNRSGRLRRGRLAIG
jgi:Homeodomain-like domain